MTRSEWPRESFGQHGWEELNEARGREVSLPPKEDPVAPPSTPTWSALPLSSGEIGDGASGKEDQAAGLGRDEGFPWQPLLAHHPGGSADSPGSIPVDLEANTPGS